MPKNANEIRHTLRLALYSAGVRRTFMLTYMLFMVVMKYLFPQFVGKFSVGVEYVKMHLNLVDLSLQVVKGLLNKSNKYM